MRVFLGDMLIVIAQWQLQLDISRNMSVKFLLVKKIKYTFYFKVKYHNILMHMIQNGELFLC